jgi:hypothetical protein
MEGCAFPLSYGRKNVVAGLGIEPSAFVLVAIEIDKTVFAAILHPQ